MKILLAVDDSRFSEAAAQTVLIQASPQRDEVLVVHVVDILTTCIPEMAAYYPGVEHGRDAQRKIAETLVDRFGESLCKQHLRVSTHIEWGNPKSKIIDTAAGWCADLIVLGSHGLTGLDRFLMGSVASAVIHHAHCSVELVRIPAVAKGTGNSEARSRGKLQKILLPVDDSTFSEGASQFLSEQVLPSKAEIRVMHVVEPPTLLVFREMCGQELELQHIWEDQTQLARAFVDMVAERFRGKQLEVTTRVAEGDPKSKILDEAQQWKADLIVMGSHGRTSFARFLLGSVSDAVASHACCSVELVRKTSSN